MTNASLPSTLIALSLSCITTITACDVTPDVVDGSAFRGDDSVELIASDAVRKATGASTIVTLHDEDVTTLVGRDDDGNEVFWVGSFAQPDGTTRLDWRMTDGQHSLTITSSSVDADGNIVAEGVLDGGLLRVSLVKDTFVIESDKHVPALDLEILGALAQDEAVGEVMTLGGWGLFWCLLEAGLTVALIVDCYIAINPSTAIACYSIPPAAAAAAHSCGIFDAPPKPPKDPGGGGATGEECSEVNSCEENDEVDAVCGNDKIEPGETCEGEPYDGQLSSHLCPYGCLPERYCGDTCVWETVCEC